MAALLGLLRQCSMWARNWFSGRCPKSVSQSMQALSSGLGGGGGGAILEGISSVSGVDMVLGNREQPEDKSRV